MLHDLMDALNASSRYSSFYVLIHHAIVTITLLMSE